jgi:hypothetical protein
MILLQRLGEKGEAGSTAGIGSVRSKVAIKISSLYVS